MLKIAVADEKEKYELGELAKMFLPQSRFEMSFEEGFAAVVNGIASEKGGSLRVSEEAAPIENGFLLKYGGIEENCSLKALFTSMRDRLQDKVNEALW